MPARNLLFPEKPGRRNPEILLFRASLKVTRIKQISNDERARLQLLPVVTMWINNGTQLTEQEIRSMARLHPDEFEYAKKTPATEMFKAAEGQNDNRLYRDLIAIVLSDKGRKWVERAVNICKKIEI